MNTVLICDDDKAIVESIRIYLEKSGFDSVCCYNGAEAVKAMKENEISCVIMDIMMPFMNGLEATVEIRKFSSVPVIFLSAKSEDEDKILGLGYGADDYVTKPFSPAVLVARVKAQVRRFVSFGEIEKSNVLTTGSLSLDTEASVVTLDGKEIKFTATEYGILKFLMENMGKLMSTSQIYEQVWGMDSFACEKTVTVHIRRIREKIEADPKNPTYLKVAWGIGYKIEKI